MDPKFIYHNNMKNNLHNSKGLLNLSKALLIAMLLGFGLKATAQCTASFTWAADPSNNGEVTFANSSSSGTGLNYWWDFSDGTGDGTMNPTHDFNATGTFTVCLTVYDSLGMFDSTLGCWDHYCATISVTDTASPSGGSCTASFTETDSSAFAYFYNTSTAGAFSTWDFGDGTTGTSTGSITHTYPGPGMYWVCLTISTFAGCTDTYCDSVVIDPFTTPSCYAMYTASGPWIALNFDDQSLASSSATYFWDFGDGVTSTTVGDITHGYPGPGTYMACLTITDSACTDTYCMSIVIGSGTPCDASFTLIQDSTNIYNYSAYLNTSPASGSYASYYWDFGDGSSSVLQYPSHTYAGSGPYWLCLTVSDTTAFGTTCTDTYCDSLTAGMAMWSALTLHVLPGSATAIEETNTISSLESYPNPMSGNATINYTILKDADVELLILDLVGNKIAALDKSSKTAGTHTANWNAEGVAQGMYLMQLRVNNNISTKKLIITR